MHLASNGAVLESAVARRSSVRISLAAGIVEVDVVGTVVEVAVLHVLVGVDADQEVTGQSIVLGTILKFSNGLETYHMVYGSLEG